MLDISRVTDVIKLPVLVQFTNEDGSVYQGEFTGIYKRLEQPRIDHLVDNENAYTVSEVVDEIMTGADDIGKGGQKMTPEEGLAWVKKTPECVGAAYAAFFRAMRPERYNEKTQKKLRKHG